MFKVNKGLAVSLGGAPLERVCRTCLVCRLNVSKSGVGRYGETGYGFSRIVMTVAIDRELVIGMDSRCRTCHRHKVTARSRLADLQGCLIFSKKDCLYLWIQSGRGGGNYSQRRHLLLIST